MARKRTGVGRAPSRARHADERAAMAAQAADGEAGLVGFLACAFVVSGAAGLMHEVVWTRLLGHLFGVTTFAISAVLGAYMGGLALGSYWMGRRIHRYADQRRVYAWLELGIGLFALAVPWILDAVEPLYGWLWRRFQFSFLALSAVRLVIAGAILLVPTFLMGATLPALAEYLARRRSGGLAPEWLYTLNLVGAVAGTAIAGFLLMPVLGVWGTIVVGAGLNLAVAAAVLSVPSVSTATGATIGDHGVGGHRLAGTRATALSAEAQTAGTALVRVQADLPVLLATSAFVSGLVSLATQVAWNRVLLLVVGSTTYAFSSVLLVYLLALGAGSALAARLASGMRDAQVMRALGLALSAFAVLTVAAVWLASRLSQIYLSLYGVSEPAALSGLVLRGCITALVVLGPSVLAGGMVLPLTLVAAMRRSSQGPGVIVGTVYAANTVGSISGAILGGFVLVPLLGTQRTLLSLSLLAAATALALSRSAPGAQRSRAWAPAIAAVATALAATILLPPWRQTLLHSGVYEPGRHFGQLGELLDDTGETVLFHREGRNASVLVTQHISGARSLIIDARTNASNHPGDMATQSLVALIPLLLAPHTDDVFVVGWGSGTTVGAALQSPVRRVVAVELEPAVVEASHLFRDVNYDPAEDARLVLVSDDARHVLSATDETFDVIVNEPSHPWVVGVSNLFTQDFYQIAAERLRPDGVISQWIQSYEVTLNTYRTILATFTSVFPHAMVFYTPYSTDTVVVGSRVPLSLDLDRLAERSSQEPMRSALARIGMARSEYLLAALALGPEDVRRLARGAPINTDDNMLVEFDAVAGSLVGNQILPEIEKRATAIESLLDDAVLFNDPAKLGAYVEGLRLVERDATRYAEQLERLQADALQADPEHGDAG